MKDLKVVSAASGLFAFLLATACCWLPFLAVAVGGAAGLTTFSTRLEKYSSILFLVAFGFVGYSFWLFFQKRKKAKNLSKSVVLQSVITCPACGFSKTETMPTDACQFFYECENCKKMLRPKPGDCCVFCSFGSVKCPPIQAGNACC